MTINNDQELIGIYAWYMTFLDTCYRKNGADPHPNLTEAYEYYMSMCGDFYRQVEKQIDTYLDWRMNKDLQILLPL